MDLEIESLLFKQVPKPKNYFMIKIHNLWEDRYRINVYVQFNQDNLTKLKIYSSYFCRYSLGNLSIMDDLKKTP